MELNYEKNHGGYVSHSCIMGTYVAETASELGQWSYSYHRREILAKKGFQPELSYVERAEILELYGMCMKLSRAPWLIDEAFLDLHHIDLLVTGMITITRSRQSACWCCRARRGSYAVFYAVVLKVVAQLLNAGDR